MENDWVNEKSSSPTWHVTTKAVARLWRKKSIAIKIPGHGTFSITRKLNATRKSAHHFADILPGL